MRLIVVVLLVTLISSCQKEESNVVVENGTYRGVFLRSSPTAKFASVNITLTLDYGAYSGTSEGSVPLICNGSYSIEGSTIRFFNNCVALADISDPSVVLDGEFLVERQSGELTFSQNWGELNAMYRLNLKKD